MFWTRLGAQAGLFVGGRPPRADRAPGQPPAREPPDAARRSGAAGPPQDRRRPARRCPAPGRAQRPRPRDRRDVGAVRGGRSAVGRWRAQLQLRRGGHARRRPARDVGHRRGRRAAGARRRGGRDRGVGDAAAVDPPRAVLAHRRRWSTRSSAATSASSCSSCRSTASSSRSSTACCSPRWSSPARRYLLATTRGGEVVRRPGSGSTSRCWAGCTCCRSPFGYQLDKYELVYSTRASATAWPSRTPNARFLAYDVLTLLSGLAGALLIAGAFTRWMWPLGRDPDRLVLGLDRRSAGSTPRRSSASASTRTRYAQEQPYIAQQHLDDAARVRARRMADAVIRRRRAADRRPRSQSEEDTFTNARLWDYRPLADDPRPAPDGPPVLRLPRRRHGPLPDRRHAAPGDAVGPRAGDRQGPGRAELGQPADHQHPRDRRRDGARQRGHPGGPAAAVDPRPAADVEQRGARDHAAADLLRRERQPLRRRARQPAGVRLSRSNSNTGQGDPTTSWTGQTGIPIDSTLSRLLFAIRFRDFDLLITRPGPGRQPAPVPPDDLGAAGHGRAVPALRQGPLPGGGATASSSTSRTRTP